MHSSSSATGGSSLSSLPQQQHYNITPSSLRKRNIASSFKKVDTIKKVIFHVITGGIFLYGGILLGIQFGYHQAEKDCSGTMERTVRERVLKMEMQLKKQQQQQQQQQQLEVEKEKEDEEDKEADTEEEIVEEEEVEVQEEEVKEGQLLHGEAGIKKGTDTPRFSDGIKSFANGMTLVNRGDFGKLFDMGIPFDPSRHGNNRVLVLHSGEQSLPSDPMVADLAKSSTHIPDVIHVEDAVENCDVMNVVLTEPNKRGQCIAIMGQYNSFHVQRWMRIPPPKEEEEKKHKKRNKHNNDDSNNDNSTTYPLRYVNRNMKENGGASIHPPLWKHTEAYWKESLVTYLSSLDTMFKKLQPILKKIAIDQTVIVMVCNFGQSELLMNFACNARAKHIDISNVLVFATDPETKELAKGIGFTVFYDQQNFGRFPKEAAKQYADKTFTSLMMAKVYCVHLVNTLGYNVLFQDVDIVWYRNPLEYFSFNTTTTIHHDHDQQRHHDPHMLAHPKKGGIQKQVPLSSFDMYFQEDGNRGQYYAPYSANTGFYFVRYNDRTRYFFSQLLLSGDLIASSKSHQIAVTSLLAEHSSMFGLRIKVLPAEDGLFPGGFTFHKHKKKQYMLDLMKRKLPEQPYLFHMSWTHSKHDKEKYFKQMGEWYLSNEIMDKNGINHAICPSQTEAHQIVANHHAHAEDRGIHDGESFTFQQGYLQKLCCSAQPLFSCHYRDKPSLHKCSAAPPIDKGGKSWW